MELEASRAARADAEAGEAARAKLEEGAEVLRAELGKLNRAREEMGRLLEEASHAYDGVHAKYQSLETDKVDLQQRLAVAEGRLDHAGAESAERQASTAGHSVELEKLQRECTEQRQKATAAGEEKDAMRLRSDALEQQVVQRR